MLMFCVNHQIKFLIILLPYPITLEYGHNMAYLQLLKTKAWADVLPQTKVPVNASSRVSKPKLPELPREIVKAYRYEDMLTKRMESKKNHIHFLCDKRSQEPSKEIRKTIKNQRKQFYRMQKSLNRCKQTIREWKEVEKVLLA